MPYKPSRPCPGKGPRYRNCRNLIKDGESCCAKCKPFEKAANRRYDRERDQTPERQFLHSTRWRKIAALKSAINPLCERCLTEGLVIQKDLVHHKDRNELNNDLHNLESLCNDCHEDEHRKERWGR